MAKPISTRKLVMLMLSLASVIVIFFAMSLSASAASYSTIKLDVPRISQRPSTGDCAIASMATIEAYCHGLPSGNYNSKAYQAVYSANGNSISASWSKLGYKTIEGFNKTTVYNQLKRGYPVIVHRTSQHYSVIYGYDGSTSKLELSGFLVVDVDDSYNSKTAYFRLDSWVRGSLDRMVVRLDGLAISSDELKITNNHPPKEMAKGEDFTVYGMVVSDSELTKVSVSVNNAAGAQKQSYSVDPKGKSFALSAANGDIDLSSLASGSYVYWITAKDASGSSKSYKFNFTIDSKSYVEPSVDIKEVSYTAIVKADPSLNMRKGAGMEYAVIESIPYGTKISVTGECDGWARVSYSGKVGWVSLSYIEKTADKPDINPNPSKPSVPDSFASYYARVSTAGALREKAFVFSATVISVPKNAVVKVIGESNGWVKFAYNGKVGWFRKNSCVVNLGDVDANGAVNSVDALAVLQTATGTKTLTSKQKEVADFNGDGSVNSIDALTVLQVTTGKLKFD
ncbi:MAG: SH3 domain-containing protein [Clostridia bacterium]|nr:SH3 domain-containing protein [Clostridia bacterium]